MLRPIAFLRECIVLLFFRNGSAFLKIQLQASRPRVEPPQGRIQIIQLPHGFIVQHLGGFSAREDLLSLHADDPVRNLHRQIDLMERHHDGDSLLPGHFVQYIEKLQLMADIQIGCGLVKDDDLRLLTDGACQEDPLALTVTDSVKGPVCQFQRMNHMERLIHLPLIRLRQDPETSGIGIAAHCRHIPACHQFCPQAACKHDRHLLCQFIGRILFQFFQLCCMPVLFFCMDGCFFPAFCQKDLAADRRELARDRLKDRGLAGAVRPRQRHDLPFLQADLYAADQRFSFITDSQPAQL